MEYKQTWVAPHGFRITIENSYEFDASHIRELCESIIKAIDKNEFIMAEKPLENDGDYTI